MKKKRVIVLIIVLSLLLVIGISFAYFVGQIGPGKTVNINLTSGKTDNLNFTVGNAINIHATQENFTRSDGNLSGSTNAKAILTANNGSTTQHYSVYLKINTNNFIYTTAPTNTPELMLKVTNPSGTVVNSITGLTYTTSGGVSGFDITTKTGLVEIANNYSITTSSTKTDTWTVQVSFINLSTSQKLNGGKVFDAEVIITPGELEYSEYTREVASDQLVELKALAQSNTAHDGVYYIDSDGLLDYGDGTKYDAGLTADRPQGVVSIWNKKIIYACLKYNDNNFEYDTKKTGMTERTMPCLTNRNQNLVVNGDLSFGNNDNLSSFGTYTSGYLTKTLSSSSTPAATDFIPIDPNKTYVVSYDFKSSNTTATYYGGFYEFDADKNTIGPNHVMYITNTLTTLAQDLKPNDKVVYLTDLTNWNVATSTRTYQRGFIFWNYKDSTGYQYTGNTYSRNVNTNLYTDANVNKTNNTITLTSESGWSGSTTIPAGTAVSQPSSGGTFNYSVMSGRKVTTSWVNYSTGSITGYCTSPSMCSLKFRAGTKFIKLAAIYNYNKTADTITDIKNISIREVSS